MKNSHESAHTKFNIAIVTSPFDDVRGESNVINRLQTLEPISDNIFAIVGNLPEYPNKKVKITRLGRWRTEGKPLPMKMLNHTLTDLQISLNLLKVFRNVDIVAFHIGARYYLLSAFLSKMLRRKVVAFSFSTTSKIAEVNARLKGLKRGEVVSTRLERFVLSLADQIAVESESVIRFSHLEKFRNKISIYGAKYMDLSLFKKEKGLKDRKKLVGYIGGLGELKGVTELAKAIPLILKEQSDIEFLIGGEGPLFQKISEALKAEEDLGRVKFAGWIPHDEVPDYLNEMKLLVLPSYSEGLPGIVQEAMACGTPVLATPVGGVPDIIKDGETGFIMEDNSPECISKNVIRALNHPNLEQIAQNARDLVEREFTFEKAVERYREILNDLLNKR